MIYWLRQLLAGNISEFLTSVHPLLLLVDLITVRLWNHAAHASRLRVHLPRLSNYSHAVPIADLTPNSLCSSINQCAEFAVL